VNRLRNRLILVFLAGTLVPLGATLWISASLLEHSLNYAVTDDLDRLSKTLEQTARQLYQDARVALKEAAAQGAAPARQFEGASRAAWPAVVSEFRDSGDAERFVLAGDAGDELQYLVRRGEDVLLYRRGLGNVRMREISDLYAQARGHVEDLQRRDLRRGFTYTLLVLGASVWVMSLLALTYVAHRISRPIRQLTQGLSQLAAGRYETRLQAPGEDEVGRALQAFNDMAARLQENRDRLVYLTQVASWQLLARKMAHELKNSLTPIRLTAEELVARGESCDAVFLKQAAQIITEEVETLQRRVRAFSEFSSEPVPAPGRVSINELLSERVEFLRVAHPDVCYELRLADAAPQAFADADHVKGIITNLLENAAEAVPAGGEVMVTSGVHEGKACAEVHDSGPGLREDVKRSLFEPTISFKENGMGLGLSISRKNALLAGGDLQLIEGRLGGAAFRLLLPLHPGN
jgi:nitrogen fixation/metabolism regulation signal transduction histidine kinase